MLKTRDSRVFVISVAQGDADLISIKALKAIRNAHIILYEERVPRELLGCAPVSCRLLGIDGIRSPVSDLNRLTVSCAKQYRNVVILGANKPVDWCYVEYLVKAGINVEVIPGGECVLAALSGNGIPVTRRGINESFYVIDSNRWRKDDENNVRLAATSSATVIVTNPTPAMVKYIAEVLISSRGIDEPIGVIQHHGESGQKFLFGSFRDLSSLTGDDTIASRFLLVIGKVVNESILKIREERSSHGVVL
jgi:uroporphyrin-III C-methyltransferase